MVLVLVLLMMLWWVQEQCNRTPPPPIVPPGSRLVREVSLLSSVWYSCSPLSSLWVSSQAVEKPPIKAHLPTRSWVLMKNSRNSSIIGPQKQLWRMKMRRITNCLVMGNCLTENCHFPPIWYCWILRHPLKCRVLLRAASVRLRRLQRLLLPQMMHLPILILRSKMKLSSSSRIRLLLKIRSSMAKDLGGMISLMRWMNSLTGCQDPFGARVIKHT
mmetsp:Transcript_9539/g.14396  ORF Transcript_9539/g.14396 Transcript_9539/m.14396 type:complete len:216 (+) Transcript_9539:151-798(+)